MNINKPPIQNNIEHNNTEQDNPDDLAPPEPADQESLGQEFASGYTEIPVEPVSATGNQDSPPQDITDLTATELSSETNTPNDPVALDDSIDIEQERKKIVDKNLKALHKRFGETFVKGKRLDSGEFAGGGAREILSAYMEIPDFASKVKQLIPNKHGALSTLQDNQDYILAYLEDAYKDDEYIEQEELKNPYELARVVGYELTGPFERIEDFLEYEADFRQGERICTYNNPQARLDSYHILWLRSVDASDIPPADKLTQDNLTDSWKTYLKTVGRYDAESDSYNLEGLRPSRQDPYGVSSMSVQISRTGNHVSIKNRYNHSVTNPDSTFDNNLDFIAYGLGRSVYHQVGRED